MSRVIAWLFVGGLFVAVVSAQGPDLRMTAPRGVVGQQRLTTLRGAGIIGVALDSRRAAAPGVSLQLRDLNRGGIVQTTVADLRGEYIFAAIEPGIYVVELRVGEAVVDHSAATVIAGVGFVRTWVQLPGRWDAGRRVVEPDVPFGQFVGASAAATMASQNMMNAAVLGIPSIDPGVPVSGQRVRTR
jgi:hypothetical protein